MGAKTAKLNVERRNFVCLDLADKRDAAKLPLSDHVTLQFTVNISTQR